MNRWAEYLDHPRIKALTTYSEHRQYSRIEKILGLDKQAAMAFAAFLRGDSPNPTDASNDEAVKIEASEDETIVSAKSRTIRTLDELLAAADVDRKRWRVVKWVANKWDGQRQGGDPVELWQVKAWLERKPDWISPVQPVRHVKRKLTSGTPSRGCALIMPDSQNGYRWRGNHDELDPLHDRRAWDVAIQVAQRLKPSVIVLLGDMLDLAPWSTKYPRGSNLSNTTQPALAELHWWLGQLRMASPAARILYLEGNHEIRIAKALKALLREADGIRPVDDPDGPAALSVARLLALDALDIEYLGPYDSEHWLWGAIRVHHGEIARRRGGATVAEVVRDATHHEIIGHIHRLELACRTTHGPDGERMLWALSPGTIARVDGIVPAASSRVDWQQGLAIVERTDDGLIVPSLLPIQGGRTVLHREIIEGRDRLDDLRGATGWAF